MPIYTGSLPGTYVPIVVDSSGRKLNKRVEGNYFSTISSLQTITNVGSNSTNDIIISPIFPITSFSNHVKIANGGHTGYIQIGSDQERNPTIYQENQIGFGSGGGIVFPNMSTSAYLPIEINGVRANSNGELNIPTSTDSSFATGYATRKTLAKDSGILAASINGKLNITDTAGKYIGIGWLSNLGKLSSTQTWTGTNTFSTTSTGTGLIIGNGTRTVTVDFSRSSTSPRIIAGSTNTTTFSIENANGQLDLLSGTGTIGFTNTARGPNGGVVFQAYMDIANGSGSPTKSCGLILNGSGGGTQWPMGFINNNSFNIVGFDFYSNNTGLGTTSFLKCSNSAGTFFNIANTGKVTAKQYQISDLNTAPSSSTDTGVTGEIRVTASYIYVCTATNTWVRSPLTTW